MRIMWENFGEIINCGENLKIFWVNFKNIRYLGKDFEKLSHKFWKSFRICPCFTFLSLYSVYLYAGYILCTNYHNKGAKMRMVHWTSLVFALFMKQSFCISRFITDLSTERFFWRNVKEIFCVAWEVPQSSDELGIASSIHTYEEAILCVKFSRKNYQIILQKLWNFLVKIGRLSCEKH